MTKRRECLAVVGVCEEVAGVVDVHGVLVGKGTQEKCEKVRTNGRDSKAQRTGLESAYVGRNRQITAASGSSPVRDGGGLGA